MGVPIAPQIQVHETTDHSVSQLVSQVIRSLELPRIYPLPPRHATHRSAPQRQSTIHVRRRAARMEPVRRDPQLPVGARVPHVPDRRRHRLHRVRPRLRPPRPRLRLRLLATAAAAASIGGTGGGVVRRACSSSSRREGRGRGVPCGVRGARGRKAGRGRAVAAGGAGELPAGEGRRRGQGQVDAGHRLRAAAPAAAPGSAAGQQEVRFVLANFISTGLASSISIMNYHTRVEL